MAKKKKRKISIKKVLCLVLAGVAMLTVIGGVAAFASKDSKSISWREFSVGDIDAEGKFVESEQSLCTKEAFNCIGLRIVPEFDSKLTYDVFYYDYNDVLLDAKMGLTGVYDEDYPLAKTARIAIHPEAPEGVKEKDFKIDGWDIRGYANKLKITVDKEQTYLYANSINLYNEDSATLYKTFYQEGVKTTEWNTLDASLVENSQCIVSDDIKISGEYKKYDIFVRCTERDLPPNSYLIAVIADSEGKVVMNGNKPVYVMNNVAEASTFVWHKVTIEVPEDVEFDHLRVSMPSDVESCYIFGY